MEQSIVSIGNSAGIIIPAKLRSEANVKLGSKVFVSLSPDKKTFIVSTSNTHRVSSITPEFLKIVERVNKRYGSVFAALAKK